MPTKEELGRRLRVARFEKNLTLKQVATRCGMSATHISEVERGKTSPTIGALQRIAAALGENPSHFVREDIIEPVKFTPAASRCSFVTRTVGGAPTPIEFVTAGIRGGYVQVILRVGPPGESGDAEPRIGEIVVLCVRGAIRVTVCDQSWTLREGDTLQTRMDDGFAAEVVGDEEAESLWIMAAPVLIPV